MSEYVEQDFMGRFGRYSEVLGKGAFKTVYRGFDEVKGIEVAWNKVEVNANLAQVYSEVQILRHLNHGNIMRIHSSSWMDMDQQHLNFITELCTSGTLREYRGRHKHIRIQVIKNLARQILTGLNYLHTQDPPIAHRDLKCANIFVDSSRGEVKIGDFGLATVVPGGHGLHDCAGTPEFTAPEVYEGDYDQLVDIYSFGMCLVELVTNESPYRECGGSYIDIFLAVTSGQMPAALGRVRDPQVKAFVDRCLSPADSRPTASELLLDPFLRSIEDRASTCTS